MCNLTLNSHLVLDLCDVTFISPVNLGWQISYIAWWHKQTSSASAISHDVTIHNAREFLRGLNIDKSMN